MDGEEQDSPASGNSKNNNTSDSKNGDNDKFLVHFRRHCQRHDTDIAAVTATTTTTDFLVSKVVVACGVAVLEKFWRILLLLTQYVAALPVENIEYLLFCRQI